jgi:hypothetical protein
MLFSKVTLRHENVGRTDVPVIRQVVNSETAESGLGTVYIVEENLESEFMLVRAYFNESRTDFKK